MSRKLNRGDSHISIGEYMVQAGWPGVGGVRKILGYDDSKIQPERVPLFRSYNDNARILVSTLDNPWWLKSTNHEQYDPTAMGVYGNLEPRARITYKLIQGWQQLRGSFEPIRKSLKGLTKIVARYKSRNEILHNDVLSFAYGAGNVVEGVAQIVFVPFFLIFRLLKHLWSIVRHPFTGASYKNLVVRFARDIGYSGTWLIEGALETGQGVIRIVMQIPKWFIQIPLRGFRTLFIGSKTMLAFSVSYSCHWPASLKLEHSLKPDLINSSSSSE